MPEEDLVYKVTLDTSAIAGKLEELKNNLDVAFGANAFTRLGPDLQPFQNLAQQWQTGIANINLDALRTALPETSNKFLHTTTEGFLASRDFTTGFSTKVDRLMDASRLGFQKFTTDLELAGLVAGTRPVSLANGMIPNVPNKSTLGLMTGLLGFGYNPDMGISAGEYGDWVQSTLFSDRIPNLIGFGGETAIGLAGLGAGGLLGGLGAAGLGMGFSWLVDASASTWQRDLQRSRFIQNTSWRFDAGQFTNAQSMALSRRLNDVMQSPQLRLEGINRQEAESVLFQYTQAGGFDSVRTAEEYAQRFTDVLENVQRVRHILHTTLESATRSMSQWNEMGLLEGAGVMPFAQRLGAQAQVAGMLPGELASLGQQGAQMVQGTGIPLAVGFQGAADIATAIRAGQRNNMIPAETIRQLGGVSQAALMLERGGLNYGMSPTGTVMSAALFQGADPSQLGNLGFMGQLQMAGGLFDTPENYYKFRYQQPQILGKLGAQQLGYLQVLTNAEEFQVMRGALGLQGPIPQQELAGYLFSEKGIPWAQADLMTRIPSEQQAQELLNQQITNIRQQRFNEVPSIWSVFTTNLDQTFIQPLRNLTNNLSYGWQNIAQSAPVSWLQDQVDYARGFQRIAPGTLFPAMAASPATARALESMSIPEYIKDDLWTTERQPRTRLKWDIGRWLDPRKIGSSLLGFYLEKEYPTELYQKYDNISDAAKEATDRMLSNVSKISGVSGKEMTKLAEALGTGKESLIRRLQIGASSDSGREDLKTQLTEELQNAQNVGFQDRSTYLAHINKLTASNTMDVLDIRSNEDSQRSYWFTRGAELKISSDLANSAINDDKTALLEMTGVFTPDQKEVIAKANAGDPKSMDELIKTFAQVEKRPGVNLSTKETRDITALVRGALSNVNYQADSLSTYDIESSILAQYGSGTFISTSGEPLDDKTKKQIEDLRQTFNDMAPLLRKLESLIDATQTQTVVTQNLLDYYKHSSNN